LGRFDLFEPFDSGSTDGTSIGALPHLFAAFGAETEMVARFDDGIDFFCETNDAVVVFASSSVDVVKLGHYPVNLEFFQENLPMVLACVFDGIFCNLVLYLAHHPQNDCAACDLVEPQK